MSHCPYTSEQKEEVKKAIATGILKATILIYLYPEVSVEKMSDDWQK
jgi:type IV secretion system protein VirD4